MYRFTSSDNQYYSKKIFVVTLNANGGYLENNILMFVEGDDVILPTITREGYKFAGWYIELVQKNTLVQESLSIKFTGILETSITLYAGWTK